MGFRRWAAALLALLLSLTLGACGSDPGANRTIVFEIDGAPKNVDPQLARSETELLIVRNSFEGLCRIDENGQPAPALAQDVAVQGTRYTFTLREKLKWQDDTPLTAADVVFGIRRALLPETRAPFAQRLYSIKNAKKVHEGKLSPDKLGIHAPDERTVVFELEKEDNEFLQVLATSVAMPCKEEFFQGTGGRYGLSASDILCNGPFYVRAWDSAQYLRLNRNQEYETREVRPSGVLIYFNRDPAYRADRLSDGRCDAALSPASMVDSFLQSDIHPQLVYNTTWMLVLDAGDGLFAHRELRQAAFESLDFEGLTRDLPANLIPAEGLVPPGLQVRGMYFREHAKSLTADAYRPDEAKTLLDRIIREKKISVKPIELLYSDSEVMRTLATGIAQSWQQALGLVVNIREVSRTSLQSAVSAGGFGAALVPVTSDDGSVKNLLTGISERIPLSGVSVQSDLRGADVSLSDDAFFAKLEEIEGKMARADNIFPLVHDGICLAMGKNISEIGFGFGAGEIEFLRAGKLS